MPTNLEVIKTAYEAFSRGDVPAILSTLTDDVVFETEGPARLGFTGTYRGHAGAIAYFTALATEHRDVKLTINDYFEGPDSIATFGRYECTLTVNSAPVNSPIAHLFRFRDGKIYSHLGLSNTGAILEALDA